MGKDDPRYAVERGETTIVLLKTDTLPSVQEQPGVPTIRTIGRKNTLAVQMVSNSLTLPKKSQILRRKAIKKKALSFSSKNLGSKFYRLALRGCFFWIAVRHYAMIYKSTFYMRIQIVSWPQGPKKFHFHVFEILFI